MKLLLITLFTFSILAKESSPKKTDKDDLIVSDVKVQEIDKSLKSNQDILNCKSDNIDQTQKCINEIVGGLDEKQLKAISDDLGESAFKVDGGARSESIKNFMKDRISKLIYGDKKKEDNVKTPKVVGHEAYREIYKSQLGKNMLLDINSYCLESIGSSDPKSILRAVVDGGAYKYGFVTVTDGSLSQASPTPQNADFKSIVSSIFEYTRGKTDVEKKTRSTETLTSLKKASIKLYNDSEETAKAAGSFCRQEIIPKMCEYYKCISTKQADLSGANVSEVGSEKYRCKEEFNITTYDVTEKKGQIACTLVKKLENYKKVFASLQKQKDFYVKEAQNTGFSGVSEEVKADYSKIDEITSVGSKELTNEVESLKKIEEDTKKIDDECLNSSDTESDFCKGLASTLSKDDKENVNFENELANAVYAQKVDLASKSTEDLTKFLKENGLLDKYKDKIDKLTPDEVAKIIKNDYKSKKDSLKETMMNKLNALKGSSSGDEDGPSKDDKIKAIANKKDNLKDDKEYIETMYEYNNIVTSYLELTKDGEKKDGSDREVVGSFGQNKKAELAALEKYKDESDENRKAYDEYKDLFSDKETSQSSANSNSMDSVDFIGFLDSVLGTPKKEKDK